MFGRGHIVSGLFEILNEYRAIVYKFWEPGSHGTGHGRKQGRGRGYLASEWHVVAIAVAQLSE